MNMQMRVLSRGVHISRSSGSIPRMSRPSPQDIALEEQNEPNSLEGEPTIHSRQCLYFYTLFTWTEFFQYFFEGKTKVM